MERRMSEERVTLDIMGWLTINDWSIIAFDYPKSGTGYLLHPNSIDKTEKNKNGIIPDIIAVKNNIALFMENKNRFYEPDFDKLHEIKTEENFSDSLDELLSEFSIEKVFYGIGIPNNQKDLLKSQSQLEKIDFLICTNEDSSITIYYDNPNIFQAP